MHICFTIIRILEVVVQLPLKHRLSHCPSIAECRVIFLKQLVENRFIAGLKRKRVFQTDFSFFPHTSHVSLFLFVSLPQHQTVSLQVVPRIEEVLYKYQPLQVETYGPAVPELEQLGRFGYKHILISILNVTYINITTLFYTRSTPNSNTLITWTILSIKLLICYKLWDRKMFNNILITLLPNHVLIIGPSVCELQEGKKVSRGRAE